VCYRLLGEQERHGWQCCCLQLWCRCAGADAVEAGPVTYWHSIDRTARSHLLQCVWSTRASTRLARTTVILPRMYSSGSPPSWSCCCATSPLHLCRHSQRLLLTCRSRSKSSSSGSGMCLSQCSHQQCTCASQVSAPHQHQHSLQDTPQQTQMAPRTRCLWLHGTSHRSSTCHLNTLRKAPACVSRCQQWSL
jgi:hypothetical protein